MWCSWLPNQYVGSLPIILRLWASIDNICAHLILQIAGIVCHRISMKTAPNMIEVNWHKNDPSQYFAISDLHRPYLDFPLNPLSLRIEPTVSLACPVSGFSIIFGWFLLSPVSFDDFMSPNWTLVIQVGSCSPGVLVHFWFHSSHQDSWGYIRFLISILIFLSPNLALASK